MSCPPSCYPCLRDGRFHLALFVLYNYKRKDLQYCFFVVHLLMQKPEGEVVQGLVALFQNLQKSLRNYDLSRTFGEVVDKPKSQLSAIAVGAK